MNMGDTLKGGHDQYHVMEYRWQVVAASVCGTSHEKRRQLCQDAHHWNTLPEGVLVAAIADGAGSARLGEMGAAIATRTVVETICPQVLCPHHGSLVACGHLGRSFDDGAWQLLSIDAFQVVRTAIETEAIELEVAPRDLATTLILLVATPEFVAAAQVGDGAAVVGDGDGNIIALTAPQRGEYINETTFLTSPNALDTVQVNVWHGSAAHIAVFSDGIQMLALKMPDGAPHAPFFTPLFHFAAKATEGANANDRLEEFLRSSRIRGRTDDDLTLLLAARVPCLSPG